MRPSRIRCTHAKAWASLDRHQAHRTRAVDDREECAAGVSVVLSHAGETVATTGTDDFGDFLFDGLDKFSGDYLLQIQQDGQPPLNKKVKIENSVVVEISI